MNEPVLTAGGWKAHGDLRTGDVVFGADGRQTPVVATGEVSTVGDCYRVTFDDGASVVVAAEHLWTIERRTRRRVSGTNQRVRERVTIDTRTMAKQVAGAPICVQMSQPLEMSDAELPLDPYLLGAWLGDGNADSARFTSSKGDYENHWLKQFAEAGYSTRVYVDRGTCVQFSIASRGKVLGRPRCDRGPFGNALVALGVIGCKHIPERYLGGSVAQRLALLQGLMDTDGHCDGRGTATFCNTNQHMAQQVHALALSLGFKSNFRTNRSLVVNGEPYESFEVSFSADEQMPPFRMARKAQRCRPRIASRFRYVRSVEPVSSIPVSCIQVAAADGLYLVGRDLIVTHNSTVITFAQTIQDILSSHGDDPLPHWNGRELTAGIFSHNRPTAKSFLRQIKREFETNGFLKSIFPDVLWANPEREAPQWSEDEGLIVKRNSNPKEATLEASGLVDGQPIGKHYLLRIYDDVVTRDTVNTPEMIRKTTAAWELSLNLGTQGGIERYIGTRYHDADTYSEMMKRRAAVVRLHPATHNGRADGDPVLLSPQELEEKRRKMGPATFSAQMLQNPLPGDTAFFRDGDFHRFTIDQLPADLNVFMASDYAVSEGAGDYTEHGIGGFDGSEDLWLFDWWSGQTRADEWIDTGLDLVAKHQPLVWAGEKGVIQKSVEPFMAKRMEQRRVYCSMEWIARTQNKAAMARSFQAMAAAGKVHILASPWGDDLIAQLLRFPFGANDDKVDVCALFGMILEQTWGAVAKAPPPEEPTDLWGRRFGSDDSWRTA